MKTLKGKEVKNLRIKIIENCFGSAWWYGIFEGRKIIMKFCNSPYAWLTESAAIRNAKAMAKRIGIKYDPEIIKQKGC